MAAGDLSWEVQEAVVQRLLGDSILTSVDYLGGPHVFDHVPDQQPPRFICVSGQQAMDHGDKTDPGQDMIFPIRVWTREKGHKTGLRIAKRIVLLLHEQSLTLALGSAPLVRFKNGGSVQDPDGVSQQFYRNFRIITSETP